MAAFAALVLVIASGYDCCAQPGDTRTPEEARQQAEQKLNELIEYVKQYPDRPGRYQQRGNVYAELSWRTNLEAERQFFTEKALADFEKGIELEPHFYPSYLARAQLKSRDRLNNFAAILDDYLHVVSLLKKAYPRTNAAEPPSDPLSNVFQLLAEHYLARAADSLNREKASFTQWPSDDSPWQDFDTAIDYANKSVRSHHDLRRVIDALLRKGDAAFKAREFSIALAAYELDRQYLGDDYRKLCENDPARERCADDQRQIALAFSIRRARALTKHKQYTRALSEVNTYIAKSSRLECGEVFRLRADLHWALGNDAQAEADHERMKKFAGLACPFDIEN